MLRGLEFRNRNDDHLLSSAVFDQGIDSHGHVDQGIKGYLVIKTGEFSEQVFIQPLMIDAFECCLVPATTCHQCVEVESILGCALVTLFECNKLHTCLFAFRLMVKNLLEKP